MNIEDLKNKIKHYSQKYYEGAPEISDAEFDTLIEELRNISPDDPLLNKTSFGYDSQKESGKKVPHIYHHIGSLDKINISTWKKHFSGMGDREYCITSKHDGGSLVAYYDGNGNLEMVLTRGDGSIGIDVTDKIKYIIPNTINKSNIAIRGEITMKKAIFEKYYPDGASSRNTSLGVINKNNPSLEEIKRLSFIAYSMFPIVSTKSEILLWLKHQGFRIPQYEKTNIDTVKNACFLESWKGLLDTEYLADGLVITDNNNPDNEIAYKFLAETAKTTVTEIKWELSRLGSFIPIVCFNTIKLSGANLSKASGFNALWIKDNGISVGSKILVHRANEVIPYIKEVITKGISELPGKCTICSSKLIWNGVHLQCPNESCSSKNRQTLYVWCNTLARIDSLGEAILEPFFDIMGWESIEDIYSNHTWSKIETNFTAHACKLLNEMGRKLYSDPINSELFIAAFGIPYVGEETSKKITNEIGIDKFFNEPDPQLKLYFLKGITKPSIESILKNFKTMQTVYERIVGKQGFTKINTKKIKVAITGKLSKPRKELATELASYGIEVTETLNNSIDYLITDNPSSGSDKNKKAQKLGIKVISEIDFRKEIL